MALSVFENMDPHTWSLKQIFFDCFLILIVSLPIEIIKATSNIGPRGFFCNDKSIMYRTTNTSILGELLLFPTSHTITLLTLIFTEFFNRRRTKKKIQLCNFMLPIWFYNFYTVFVAYVLGAMGVTLVSTVLKGCVQRLRPIFFYHCQPNINCSLAQNQHVFHTNYECTNKNPETQLKWLSFPSGHACYAMYWAVFFIFYTERRFKWKSCVPLKTAFQLHFILIALYIGADRVFLYEHFMGDVIGGYIIGATFAVVVGIKLFRPSFFFNQSAVLVDKDPENGLLKKIRL